MGNDSELTSELTSKWISFKNIQSNFTLISLITFGVLNQTSPNLQGSCRNTCRWCLRNYMINGGELTHELMSKWITFENTQANFTLISLITFEVLHQTSSIFTGQLPWYQVMVPAKLRENRLRIDWDTSGNWVKIMTKMPRDLWIRIVDSGCVAIATVLAFLSFFVWRLLTSESDVKNRETVKIGCFTSPSIRAISEKQSFLVHFQLGIISQKKKKKKKKYIGSMSL